MTEAGYLQQLRDEPSSMRVMCLTGHFARKRNQSLSEGKGGTAALGCPDPAVGGWATFRFVGFY